MLRKNPSEVIWLYQHWERNLYVLTLLCSARLSCLACLDRALLLALSMGSAKKEEKDIKSYLKKISNFIKKQDWKWGEGGGEGGRGEEFWFLGLTFEFLKNSYILVFDFSSNQSFVRKRSIKYWNWIWIFLDLKFYIANFFSETVKLDESIWILKKVFPRNQLLSSKLSPINHSEYDLVSKTL